MPESQPKNRLKRDYAHAKNLFFLSFNRTRVELKDPPYVGGVEASLFQSSYVSTPGTNTAVIRLGSLEKDGVFLGQT